MHLLTMEIAVTKSESKYVALVTKLLQGEGIFFFSFLTGKILFFILGVYQEPEPGPVSRNSQQLSGPENYFRSTIFSNSYTIFIDFES